MENQNDNIFQPQEPQTHESTLDFDFQVASENHSIIKVVGVGGGGGNAVQHMYDAGIQDVSFLVINTDKQALKGSSIPNKLLISDKGLGAGAKPEIARDSALQYTESIRNALNDGTEMVFITAGMGGGTGTGAAPVVAQIAQEMGILTVGIVTIPFRFEGRKKIMMALEGVRAIEKYCDALIVVNNNRLIDVYPDLEFGNAFGKADDTLTTAAKSISDIINIQGYINLDFADVSTTLRNGGVALISTGSASGENRLSKAIEAATTSPLLQDNNINDARHLLFELCFSHENAISMSEIAEMNNFVDHLNGDIEVIWGAMYDDTLGDDVRIIILASGFKMDHSTGSVFANTKIEEYIREQQRQLRLAIVEKQNMLNEFSDYPEALEVLNAAIRQASEKSNNLTADDSYEEEKAKLDIALDKAREKKQEVLAAAERERMAEAERKRREEINAQIAALQEQLAAATETVTTPEPAASGEAVPATPVVVEPVTGVTPVPEAPSAPVTPVASPTVAEPAQAEQPVSTEQPAAPTVTEVPASASGTANTPAPEPTAVQQPAQPTPPVVQPASSPLEGIETIREYYGEEAVSKFMLSDVRKNYYVLDDKDLTNEELIRRLEQLPAYNRSQEDFGQLRAISRQPSQPRTYPSRNDGPDGTIKF